MNVFQKCNKIKKLGVTNEDILNALSNSDKLEINASKNSIRRKNNTALPEFKETNKKLKTENNNKQEEVKSVELKVEKQPEEPEKYEPYYLFYFLTVKL